jgi:hypothetical protein
MFRIIAGLLPAAVLFTSLDIPSAEASPSCFKSLEPYRLVNETVSWSMSIAAGADCIQGLRWSYMQIENVTLASQPKRGKVVIVGSGFRYYSNSEAQGVDRFTLVVSGKNRRDPGTTTVEIIVSQSPNLQTSSLAQ